MARDAHEVMRSLGHGRYAVCGHDIGGMVALAQAALFRDAVTHLAVLDVPLPGWSEWEQTPQSSGTSPSTPTATSPNACSTAASTTTSPPSWPSASTTTAASTPRTSKSTRAMALTGRTRGGMEWYRTLATDHAAALQYKQQPLTIPVLALGGDQRFGPRMVPMLQEFATNVSGGSIDRCSHYVADEKPEAVAAALIHFLQTN